MKAKIGLQLFTLYDTLQEQDGLLRALKAAAEAGYDGVEFAGFCGAAPETIADWLKEYGLVTAGIHLGGWDNMQWSTLERNPAEVIETAKKIGAASVVVASYGGKNFEDWAQFGKKLDHYGKMFRENGMLFGYHNHRHEVSKLNGKYIIDIVMENCAPENVFWEMDPRHIVIAREDPVAFAKRYAGRMPILHMRDVEKITGPDTGDDTAVGSGIVDIPGVVHASGNHEWLIVEEGPGPKVAEHIRMSEEYLRKTF